MNPRNVLRIERVQLFDDRDVQWIISAQTGGGGGESGRCVRVCSVSLVGSLLGVTNLRLSFSKSRLVFFFFFLFGSGISE